jgi:type I restriction enzyme S subunit
VAPLREQEQIIAFIEEQVSRLDAGGIFLRKANQNIDRIIVSMAVAADAISNASDSKQATLADVADIDSGPAFPSSSFRGPGEGIKLLRGDNIEPGALRWTKTKTWPIEKMHGFEHLYLEARDLILAMDRPVISTGLKLARVTTEDLPALLVQRVARIRPKPGIDSRYLYIMLMSPRFIPHILRSQTGTQLPHITLAGIRSFLYIFRPMNASFR